MTSCAELYCGETCVARATWTGVFMSKSTWTKRAPPPGYVAAAKRHVSAASEGFLTGWAELPQRAADQQVLVRESAIDHNQHVNQAQYLSYALDCLPEAAAPLPAGTRVYLDYMGECKAGDVLTIQCSSAPGRHAFNITRQGQALVRISLEQPLAVL